MNGTIKTLLAILAIILFAVTPAIAELNIFEPELGIWHDGANWSLGHIPRIPDPFAIPPVLAEDVLIPANKHCKIIGGIAHAKSVEVEATGKLGVENSKELFIHSTEAAPTALTIDGTLYFRGTYAPDIPATLRLAVTAQFQEDVHLLFTGDGVITAAKADDPDYPTTKYGPAQLITPAGRETDPWGFDLNSGLTFKGGFTIGKLSIDNDGLVLVDGADIMDFKSPLTCTDTCCPSVIFEDVWGDGVFRVNHASGQMLFGNRNGTVLEYSADLEVSAGFMHWYDDQGDCSYDGRLNMHDGTITVSGGELRFDAGVFSEDPGGAIINVSGGLLDSQSGGGSNFDDTLVTITGGEFRTDHDVHFRELNVQPAITVTGAGEFNMLGGILFVTPDSGGKTPITINGNDGVRSLECKWFLIHDSTLSIAGGEFHVVGDALQKSLLSSSTLTLSGGTLFLGGTFDGAAGSPITVSGGTLDIRGDNRFLGVPDFLQRGAFSFTGGKIKVKKDRVVRFE